MNVLEESRKYGMIPWVAQKTTNCVNVVDAKGIYFYDDKGNKHIDFASQLVSINIGHGDKRVTDAVVEQMNKVSHLNPILTTTEAKTKLSKKLHSIYPKSLQKTLFTTGGSDSNETAAMIARAFTGRKKIISNYRSYHGSSNATFNIGGDPRKFNFIESDFGGTVKVENPYVYRCPWGTNSAEDCKNMALKHIKRVIEFENPKNIAAIIMEGESGTSGCIKYPKGYLKGIQQICNENGIVFIVDEVMSGFGRCGEWFGSIYHDVQPDIMTMAKGITSGYLPLGAVAVNEKIGEFLEDFNFTFGLTYCNHPVSCAAALKVVEIYEEDNLIDNAKNMGNYFETKLQKLAETHPSIGDIRMTGLLGIVEFVKNRESKEEFVKFNAPTSEWGKMIDFKKELASHGLHAMIRWNYLFITPPLCITKEEADICLNIIEKALPILDKECH